MRDFSLQTGLRFLLYGAMIVVTVSWVLGPFNDPDFFWHLKTGEWIWQHGVVLPAQDPFNYANRSVEPVVVQFAFRAYWLSQITYHLIHERWGFPGLAALKLLVAASLVLVLLKMRRGDPVVHAALTLAVLPLLFGVYPFDRPQVFSFLFFAVLLARLEKERTAATVPYGWASYLPIPLLMLAWANMHGGHVIGQGTIALYLALEGVKFAHPVLQPAGRERFRRLLIVGAAGLGASFIKPYAWYSLKLALFPGALSLFNAEYLSTSRFFNSMDQPLILIFWGALALTALACSLTITKPDITRIALLAGTGASGFLYVRHIPFFMIAAVPVIAGLFSAEKIRKWAPQALAAGSIVLVAFFSRDAFPSRARLGAALRVNEEQYPVRAADFVIANDLKGNLYNTWSWGGYLIWRLGPERKVLVDGRGLNPQATFLSSSIALGLAQPAGSPLSWKNNLRQYGIGYLIIPNRRSFFFDNARGLKAALQEAPEWVPVFADETALVYVLNMPEHREVIARHGIPKERLFIGS